MPAEVAVEMNGTKSARFAMTCFASMILAIGVTACSMLPGTQEETPSGNAERQVAQAEALSRKGDFRGAGRAYETLAAQSPGELRDRFLLRAAREYVRGDDTAKATSVLNQVSEALPRADFPLRSMVTAELALRGGRADKALAELDRIPQPIPRESAPDILDLRARALFAMNRPAQAVNTALERERTLSNQEEVRANQRMIWQGLQKSAANNADFTPPPGASQQLIGWLDLGRAALVSARNPFTANEDISQWRGRYPSHPANAMITEDILPELGAGLDYPTQIALILPLSGRMQAAGMAVRDGFLAALLQQDPGRRPMLNVYDSAEMGAATAYRRAVADGAQFVVGPLTKDEVTAIAASGETSVTTLALNQTAEGTTPSPLLFQFSLDPEEEARQVAQRLAADGRTRGLVLLPNNDWGRRVFQAFDSELKILGGEIAGMKFYDPAARDYSQPITQLLLIDESRARASALSSALGSRFEFEPRRRGDAQFVFIGAQPTQGRSLRPTLRFHLAEDLAVYATSDIFEPDAQGNNDLEGVIFPDMPWVVSPDPATAQLRTTLSRHWPVRARGRGRLYAFGFDACRIVPLLKAGHTGSAHTIPGMTGLLSIDENGHVKRELDWAKVSGGRAVPLGTVATAEAR
jgi:outer membrane PBP1 activator LpoA protein